MRTSSAIIPVTSEVKSTPKSHWPALRNWVFFSIAIIMPFRGLDGVPKNSPCNSSSCLHISGSIFRESQFCSCLAMSSSTCLSMPPALCLGDSSWAATVESRRGASRSPPLSETTYLNLSQSYVGVAVTAASHVTISVSVLAVTQWAPGEPGSLVNVTR